MFWHKIKDGWFTKTEESGITCYAHRAPFRDVIAWQLEVLGKSKWLNYGYYYTARHAKDKALELRSIKWGNETNGLLY